MGVRPGRQTPLVHEQRRDQPADHDRLVHDDRDETLRSGYLFQIYAYLRSQAGRGDSIADRAEGLLLHPSVDEMVDETVAIQGPPIRFATVELSAPSLTIRQQLLKVVEPPQFT